VVFEGFARRGLARALCGGGRYGNLLEALGGPAMSGVGFGTSDVVILDVLTELGRAPRAVERGGRPEVFLIDADPARFREVLRLAGRLRQGGVRAGFSYRRQSLGRQIKQAAAAGAARAVIVGDEFVERGALVVKDLTSGRQWEKPAEAFVADPLKNELV
jgi:histidyl-tRNA synthetase